MQWNFVLCKKGTVINMNNSEAKFNLDDINPVEMKMLSEQVGIILRALELYAYNLEYMLDGEKSSDDERQKKIAMLKYTYEQVLSDQAEQVNTKRNNTNNLTAYGQKMINITFIKLKFNHKRRIIIIFKIKSLRKLI